MKVLQINFSDYAEGGGGSIAHFRLLESLRNLGIDCKSLSGIKTTDLSYTKSIDRQPRYESAIRKFTYKLGLNDVHCISSFNIDKDPFFIDADIINFHIIHSGFFSYLSIPYLIRKKTAVLTLHDMWSFTGHCAYSYDCSRWQIGCGQCPYPETYPAIRRDSTRWEWKLKDWVYNRSDLTIVTPSRWLTSQAKASMLGRFPVHHIPYGIDTDAYHPLDSELCRATLGIPLGKRVLMFSAENLKDSRKGSDLLIQALEHLPPALKQDCVLLTLGKRTTQLEAAVDIPAIHLGYISSDRLKAVAYSAADLFLFPTRADNLPLVLQESMACGTPIISFDIGGVSDLVRPSITGYLARPEDTSDFCGGIIKLLSDDIQRQRLSRNCRRIALEEYSLELQAQRYQRLYQQLLNK
ncbi:glycosyltransferase family 4 protein [Nodosilinea sp. LEGE 06152]|uniref:glycosyltransferase family 4 protein n=1 Tax=Nodosilinea sp. LEGE 06152 TaxID=2777966 RepID=UPI00187DF8BB|nr:glycosyltransferase family 4 protein [Nodosilinea sp. LEGE 06152]MBE9158414.1 glycosyltransferase family 4 protein [Nodosilinea sp. LEGE 06152]